MACSGTQYTYAQLEALWTQAGGQASYAPLMAAIALAESGGCSTALNPSDNGGTQSSYGLWQLSNGTHSPPVTDWSSGLANAQGAVAKLQSQGLDAWGTYTSGAYKAFLNGAVPAGLNTTGAGGSGTQLTAADVAGCLMTFPGISVPVAGTIGGFCLLKKTEARAVLGALLLAAGGFVLLAGAATVVAASKPGQQAGTAIIGAAKATAAVGAVAA